MNKNENAIPAVQENIKVYKEASEQVSSDTQEYDPSSPEFRIPRMTEALGKVAVRPHQPHASGTIN